MSSISHSWIAHDGGGRPSLEWMTVFHRVIDADAYLLHYRCIGFPTMPT